MLFLSSAPDTWPNNHFVMKDIKRVRVIDSHTGGEPTRVVIEGAPDLGNGSIAQRRDIFARDFDSFRSAVVNEPRGNDAIVGALLMPAVDPECHTGVIFFNNVGVIQMCVHGTIGLAATLAHIGELQPGEFKIETPVGVVSVQMDDANHSTVINVPSWRSQSGAKLDLGEYGTITGDVAWGGNWFFLTEDSPCDVTFANLDILDAHAKMIRLLLPKQGITGQDGAEIDHIEIFGKPILKDAHSKNFVLCPGGAYDRSPCGTGTSAKLACLAAAGKLAEGEVWRQESIVGSYFDGWYAWQGEKIIPHIRGSAWVSAESTLILQPDDPFCHGIRSNGVC